MRASETSQQGALGATLVTAAFERLGWGVVDNSRHDAGTDLLCMARDRRLVELGLVVAVQVKAGRSFFCRPKRDRGKRVVGWWFEDRRRTHLDLWASYSIPHLLVLYDMDTGTGYWVHVTHQAVVAAGSGARILVPADQVLDASTREALLAVAGSGRPAVPLEGTAWVGALDVPETDVLRYALVVPRLVAPHRNAGFAQPVSPAQAVALIVQARLDDLGRFADKHADIPSLDAAAESADWEWRFVAALGDRVLTGRPDLLRDRVADAPDPRHRTAAATATAAALMEGARADEALELLDALADDPALSAVDRAWLGLHRARAAADVGRVEDLQHGLADTVLISATHPHDVTATAVAGAASTLLFSVSGTWDTDELTDRITKADTAASWWHAQTVASALSVANDKNFRTWAREQSITFAAAETTENKLLTACLVAGHLGDHNTWRRSALLLARHKLMKLDRSADSGPAAELLTQLRMAGDRRSVGLATRRLVRDGPAEAATLAAAVIDLETSTHTTTSSDLDLLRAAGDVLDEAVASRACRWLLDTIADPRALLRRTAPVYPVPDKLIDTLAGVLASATPLVHVEIAVVMAALPTQPDQSRAMSWARVVDALPATAWGAVDVSAPASRGHHDALRLPLLAAASAHDPAARGELLDLASSGRLDALPALGDVRRLTEPGVETLRSRCVASVRATVQEAHEGSFGFGGPDAAADLALLNSWHPEGATWDPLLDLLADPLVASEHKHETLEILTGTATRLPGDVRGRLSEIAAGIVGPSPHDRLFDGARDCTGPAAELAAALGATPAEAMIDRLTALLAGPHRRWAARVAARLPGTEHVGILVALTADPDPVVRGTAAAGLTRTALAEPDGLLARRTLARCLDDPGTIVAIGVASALRDLDPDDHHLPAARERLAAHRSARARSTVAQNTLTSTV